MIIRARVPQYGNRTRKRPAGTIQQRVAAQIEQQRRERIEACEHWFVQGKCTRCGRIR